MLTTLVLAAGESRRFTEVYGTDYPPKQFIVFKASRRTDEAQMWENSLNSLTLSTRYIAAFQHRHARWLRDSRTRPTAYIWLHPTRGQADTLLQALRRMPGTDELLVVNCDNGFGDFALSRLVLEGRFHKQCAALTMKVSDAPGNVKRWSFVDGYPTFHGAAEKRMLSPFALAGAYYFPSAEEALTAADQAVDRAFDTICNSDGSPETLVLREPYISEMFSWMPDPKLSVEINRNDFYDWGTPQALNDFVAHEIK